MTRKETKVINIGGRKIGGGNPVAIQSMTNTKTEDVESTVAQILALEKAGCDIRCAVPNMEAAQALQEIKKQIHIPLVADIHFDYRMAIAAMENGDRKSALIRAISEAGKVSALWWRKQKKRYSDSRRGELWFAGEELPGKIRRCDRRGNRGKRT